MILTRYISSLILGFLSLSSLTGSFAQDVKFARLSSEQGLSQASVNCILQDSKGYMWFGTQDGLNKFNGYEMTVYRNIPSDSNSLSHNYIQCLYEDKNEILWVGTRDGGLNTFNYLFNKVIRFMNNPNKDNSLSDNHVTAIHCDRRGVYWVGTSNGLNSFDGKINNFKKYFHKEQDSTTINGNKIECIFEDKQGRLWIGTNDGGLNLYHPNSNTFSAYTSHSDSFDDQSLNRIEAITQDDSGKLWLATDGGGLVSFNPDSRKFLNRYTQSSDSTSATWLPDNRISSVCMGDNGILWIGAKSGGVSCLNQKTNKVVSYRFNENDVQSLARDGVNSIYKDNEGSIWIGTEGGGVSTYFPNAIRFKHYRKDASNEKYFQSNTIFSILQDKSGLLWIGTMYGGITTIDRAHNTYFNYGGEGKNPLSTARSNSVLSLFEDKDDLIWVGTWGGGLNTFNKTTRVVKQIMESGAITCITQGKGNIIWIGIYSGRENKGIIGYDKSTQSQVNFTTEEGLSSNNIYCIYEDSQARLWIGTAGGGLNMLDYNKGTVQVYNHNETKNSLSNNTVNCIYDDMKGNLWIGTSNGLNKFHIATQSFTQYYEVDGLPNANIWGIQGDRHGNIWISTNNGISRFDPSDENRDGSAFKNFTTHDGLQGAEFAQGSSFINKTTGEIFFGGINGFNSFYPDKIEDCKHKPPVFLTSFKKFGKEVDLDTNISFKKRIELSYNDNFLSFEFVALDYAFPEKNKYSYKMEGVDENWSPPSSRRYVNYSSLPGGEYVFRVKACNSDGVWNEEDSRLYIKVIPPWWKTKAFYTICVLVIVLSIFGYIRYRTSKIEREKKILERRVEIRTAELAQKNADITSSIQYAKRIQDAILPTKIQISKYFPESFVLFKPKDIVSGDFYWFGEKNGKYIAACVDCTGHGVPGAFMSMIGTNLLNQIILENAITQPASILTALNIGVQTALKQGMKSEVETTDGMDIAILAIDINKKEVQFASAMRHLIVVNAEGLEKIDGNKIPIGGAQMDAERNYTNYTPNFKKGTMLYIYSDGYADQFGGDLGKKFMVKRLHTLFESIYSIDLNEQKLQLDRTFEEWKGVQPQVDDVLVIGIRI